jgi:dienelactone hydrolase
MKETSVKAPILGTKLAVHGVLRGDYSSPLAVLAPGLGGWMHDLLLFNASRYFEKLGIATLRVSFYGHEEDQRNIRDFDVKTNATDIDAVVDFAKKEGAKWVCVIGHSYSGMAIVYSEAQQFDAAVLWDPSHTDGYDDPQAKKNLENDFLYIKELDSYVSGSGPGYVLSRKVFENYAPGSTAMAHKFKVKTLVANADHSKKMLKYGKQYVASIDAPTKHSIIPDSSHPFTEDGAMEKLFEQTASWIKKASK